MASLIRTIRRNKTNQKARTPPLFFTRMRRPKGKGKVRLLPHEKELLQDGSLKEITHKGSTSTWLFAPSATNNITEGQQICYRHMGDMEFSYLLEHDQLPSTQPYQTLTRGAGGRMYCEKYLRSNKTVNTNPTTVVEFCCPKELVESLFDSLYTYCIVGGGLADS